MSRVGVIAKKIGMSALFDESGTRIPVTMLKIDNCSVVAKKEKSRDGYVALQVGVKEYKNISKASKPLQGHFKKNSVAPKKKLAEFRIDEDAMLDVGTSIKADHYVLNQFVDVSGVSIGKGFAGVMKRHNFKGMRASHGVSVSHRAHGSTGQCQDPGKVFKGKKMAGQMGNSQVTMQNLRVVAIDVENDTILVKGGVPGSRNSYVIIKDAVKRAVPESAPYPGKKQKEKVENLNLVAETAVTPDVPMQENKPAGNSENNENK
jgi:large subunit ribosomal protein L3